MTNKKLNQKYNNSKEINALFDRYKAGIATPEDLAFLESWYDEHNKDFSLVLSDTELGERLAEVRSKLPIGKFTDLPTAKTGVKLWHGLIAAASLLIAMITIFYFIGNSKSEIEILREAAVNAGIAPGGNKAILTLASGKKIVLTDATNGNIVNESGITITKTEDGKIIFKVNNSESNSEKTEWNTIETPKGGQYQIALADGSNVWLNAESKLKFPSVFSSRMRKVEVSGEAYFEITKKFITPNAERLPFVVISDLQEIEVLGTRFNVNNYKDEEAVKTTLLEGSVMIHYPKSNSNHPGSADLKGLILKPGQQSNMTKSGNIKVDSVNAQQAVDWQKGYFEFHDENVYEIMRKVARWYDIKVIYEPGLPMNGMGGTLSRFQDVSKVLDVMQSTGLVKFKIEGKKIYVRKA
nr:FecR family protein [Pedobacter panaciterrae]